MLNKILALLVVVLFILFLGSGGGLKSLRLQLEKKLLLPFRSMQIKEKEELQTLKKRALEERIAHLSAENKVLREQLGAIPEKKSLFPVPIIWYGEAILKSVILT
jgi:hypothetical protein